MGRYLLNAPDAMLSGLWDRSQQTGQSVAHIIREAITASLSGGAACTMLVSGQVVSAFLFAPSTHQR